MHHIKAFSLLEMLIVLCITTIICLMAFPQITTFMLLSHEKTLIAQLQHLIHQAAEETLIRHSPVALQIQSLSNHQQRIRLFANAKQDGVLHDERDLIGQIDVPHHGNLHARFYPRYRNFLLFFPYADLNNDNGRFWFCRKGEAQPVFTIIVNNTAETRIFYPGH